ncbi:hypothetical protein BT67DRAFT_299354 [Trichocladium antarcticum]|uniref:Uncharacterized protein n=1 Tax=Trichocladium antarcticum TaxID=1450529 RepID=A0AAN6UKB1_9PEZI|nr:hypothetical protein BT67DRAFT_299354 [Trichocladium antarcticum]
MAEEHQDWDLGDAESPSPPHQQSITNGVIPHSDSPPPSNSNAVTNPSQEPPDGGEDQVPPQEVTDQWPENLRRMVLEAHSAIGRGKVRLNINDREGKREARDSYALAIEYLR